MFWKDEARENEVMNSRKLSGSWWPMVICSIYLPFYAIIMNLPWRQKVNYAMELKLHYGAFWLPGGRLWVVAIRAAYFMRITPRGTRCYACRQDGVPPVTNIRGPETLTADHRRLKLQVRRSIYRTGIIYDSMFSIQQQHSVSVGSKNVDEKMAVEWGYGIGYKR